MNKGEAVDRVLFNFREGSVPMYWDRPELGMYYDAGLDEFLRKSGILTVSTLITCTAGQRLIQLPKHAVRALTVRDVTIPQDPVPIRLDHWKGVDMLDTYFERTTSVRPEGAVAFGLGQILLWPGYVSGGVVEVMHTATEAAPLAEVDTPRIPDEYHQALVEYIEWRALLKDVSDVGRLGRGKRHRREFRGALASASGYAQKRHTNIVRGVYGGES